MPEIHAKSAKTSPTTSAKASLTASRLRKPFLSIRGRLIVVAPVAIAPLMIERVRSLERARVDRAEVARTEVVDLARGRAAAQRETIYAIRAMLHVVTRVYREDDAQSGRLQSDAFRPDGQCSVDLWDRRGWHGRSYHLRDRPPCGRPERGRPSLLSEHAQFPRFRAQRLSDRPGERRSRRDGDLPDRQEGRHCRRGDHGVDQSAMDRRSCRDGRAAGGHIGRTHRQQWHAHCRVGRPGGLCRQDFRGARTDARHAGQ